MNKLFTKVAALTLGVAMAAGVGVAVGSAKASEVKAENALAATFTCGDDGDASHFDGSSASTYSETIGDYTLSVSNGNKFYTGARDATGNGCFKFGTSSAVGSMQFTVPSDVVLVKIYVGGYKANDAKISINSGAAQTISTHSSDGAYTAVDVNTVTSKTIAFSTASGGVRAMINTIEFYVDGGSSEKQNTSVTIQNDKPLELDINDSPVQLTAVTSPANLTLSYSSSDENVVTVSETGLVSVQGLGTSTITVAFAGNDDYNSSSDTISVSVTKAEPAHVTGKTISEIVAATSSNVPDLVYDFVGYVTSWVDNNQDGTKYGNFYIADEKGDTANQALVYGANHGNGCVWDGVKYTFSNAKDFLTDSVTSQITIGTKIRCEFMAFLYNNTKFEFQGEIIEILPDVPTDWTDTQKTNFAAALDGLVPPFVKTTADPTINTETGFVEYYGEGDVKATYVSYFTQNDWKAEGGGSYSKESPNGHGVITGYAGDATATGTYIMFQYKVYVTVTVVEGADSKEYKIGSGSDFVLPQPTESSIPAGKQFKAWEVDSKEFDPGDILEQVTSAVTVVAVYEDIPAPAPTLESIAVSGKYKTKYGYQAEEFDKEGIVVTATYSDQSQQTVDLTDVEFSGYNKSVLGEQTVTVTYQEKTTTFTVTVYYTATYKPGEGTSEDGEYVEYIENPDNYELVAFEKTGFVAPEGKQFKEWSQGTTGKSVQVNGNLSFTAVYEDIPATDWSADQKAAFGQALEGAVPPFLGAEFAGISYNAQYGAFVIVVSGNLVNQIKAAFNGLTDWVENTQYSQFRKTTAHGVAVVQYQFTEGEQEDPGSTQVIIAWSQTSWLPAQEADFESKLDNFVPPYYYVLSYMSWDDSIGAYKYAYLDPEKEDYNAFKNYFDYYFTAVEGEDGYYYYQTANGKVYVELSSTQVTQGLATFCYMYYAADPIPTSLQLDTTDVKVSYYVGDEFDATGLVVKVLDENGDVMYGGQDVAQYCEFEYDFSAAGAAVVTVKLEVEQDVFLSAEINVTVEEAPVVYDADAFAKELLEKVAPICANYDGKKNNKTALKAVWTEMALKYETLSEEEKAKVVEAAAKTDGTDLEKAMAFYNYACKKYNLTRFIAGRQVKAIVNEQVPTGNSILPIIVIVAASVTAVTAIGVVIALKRRKNFLTK